jgi:hypothetical protein
MGLEPAGPGHVDGPEMEPVELTSLEALQERIEQDGVNTRGVFAVPMAHMTDRPGLPATKLGGRVARFWWTPDYPTALTTPRSPEVPKVPMAPPGA